MNDEGSFSAVSDAAAMLRWRVTEVRLLKADGMRVFRDFLTIGDAISAVAVSESGERERERGTVRFWAMKYPTRI